LLAAIGAGVAAAFAVAQIFPTFDSTRALRAATQRPVLGTVSLVLNPAMRARGRRLNAAFAAATTGLFLIFGAWIVVTSIASRVV
jgi:hypothetical protein